jgi:hypothetical protein
MLIAIFDFNPRVNTMTPIALRKRSGSRKAHQCFNRCKKKPVFLIVYHIHYLNAIIESVYKYFKLHSIYEDMEGWKKEQIKQ